MCGTLVNLKSLKWVQRVGLATLSNIVAVMFLNMLFIDIVYNNQYDSI